MTYLGACLGTCPDTAEPTECERLAPPSICTPATPIVPCRPCVQVLLDELKQIYCIQATMQDVQMLALGTEVNYSIATLHALAPSEFMPQHAKLYLSTQGLLHPCFRRLWSGITA